MSLRKSKSKGDSSWIQAVEKSRLCVLNNNNKMYSLQLQRLVKPGIIVILADHQHLTSRIFFLDFRQSFSPLCPHLAWRMSLYLGEVTNPIHEYSTLFQGPQFSTPPQSRFRFPHILLIYMTQKRVYVLEEKLELFKIKLDCQIQLQRRKW